MSFTKNVIDNSKEAGRDNVKKSISTREFSDQEDFFKSVEEYLGGNCENNTILNGIESVLTGYKPNEINTNPYCPIEFISEPEDKYSLTDEEIQLLKEINEFHSNFLGLSLQELYKTTKIILCDHPVDCDKDLLGSYSIEGDEIYPKYPVVRLYMDKIPETANRLGCDRMYVTAAVYIHEMMHRFFDVRPDLGWKRSVKEIEEPMAEFAKLSFCEEFCKDQRHCMYIKLLPIALKLTEDLRNHDMHFIYALGADMYYNQEVKIDLIYKYRHISLLMHQVSDNDKKKEGGLTPFKYPVNEYLENNKCTKKNLKNLVEPLRNLINLYGKWFPIEKNKTK